MYFIGLCCDSVKVHAPSTSNVTIHQGHRLGTYKRYGINPIRNATMTYKHSSKHEYIYYYDPTDHWMIGPSINSGTRAMENRDNFEGIVQVCPEGEIS